MLDALEPSLAKTPADSSQRARVRSLLERGRLLNSPDQPAAARSFFERALALAGAKHLDALRVDAAHMVAITYLKEPGACIAWNQRAIALASSSKDPEAQRWMASLLNNLGWTYLDQKDPRAALPLLQQALTLREREDDAEATRIAAWSVGRAERELGMLREALAIQERLEAEYAALGRPNGPVLEELGECRLAEGSPERAAPYFAAAYRELSRDAYLVEHEADRLTRLATLGGVAAHQAAQ